MSTGAIPHPDVIAQLPADSTLVLRNVTWDEYEALLVAVGENRGLRLFYDEGTLHIMTLSSEHEAYCELLKRLVDRLSFRRAIKVLFFGSPTIKKKDRSKGTEPDACFYVKRASLIGHKLRVDFATDPAPDVVVEIDLHHNSLSKFPLYARLGVTEIWRYDGHALNIHHLQGAEYVDADVSTELPPLDARTLTGFLSLASQKDQHDVVAAFDAWLEALPR